MKNENKNYITAAELSETLGISLGQAYKIIRQLNEELARKGFITIAGKCPRRFIQERWYGFDA